jgi:hypothetical protein
MTSTKGETSAVEEAEICPLSGALAGAACPHRRIELFAAGTAPRTTCAMHVTALVDRRNGWLATASCPHRYVQSETFETFPAPFAAWARAAARPLVPAEISPLCGQASTPPAADGAQALVADNSDRAAVLFPFPGVRFVAQDEGAAAPTIVLRATAPTSVARMRFVMDGHPLAERPPPFVLTWPLVRGSHRVQVEPDRGPPSEAVDFVVD